MLQERRLISFDWAMKTLLREKSNFDILEGFISELLSKDVKIENILESESNKNSADDKSNRVDLLVRLERGGPFVIVEIQSSHQMDYMSRILYGVSKVMVENIFKGDEYASLGKVISINILYSSIGDGKDYIYKGSTNFVGMHCNDVMKMSDAESDFYKKYGKEVRRFSDLHPEYYMLLVDKFPEEVKNKIDEWMYFFKTENIMPAFSARGIVQASEKLNVLKMPTGEYKDYLRHKEKLMDAKSIESTRKFLEEEGRKKGIEEGREEGIKVGEEKGLKKGIEEGMKMGEEKGLKRGEEKGLKKGMEMVVMGMLSSGIDLDKIVAISGFKKSRILQLKKNR